MDEAIAKLMKVRGEFASRRMAFDGALVSLELAELYAEHGETATVRTLARQMAWVFQGQDVHSEAKKAIALFRLAAEWEAATPKLVHRLVEYLHFARHDPHLRSRRPEATSAGPPPWAPAPRGRGRPLIGYRELAQCPSGSMLEPGVYSVCQRSQPAVGGTAPLCVSGELTPGGRLVLRVPGSNPPQTKLPSDN